jgi:hypothetical protein
MPKVRIGTDGKKKPRSMTEQGSLVDKKQHYRCPLLDALSGLIFVVDAEEVLVIWEAKLQSPFFHFNEGSGHAVQYHLVENSVLRLQPLHSSTVS